MQKGVRCRRGCRAEGGAVQMGVQCRKWYSAEVGVVQMRVGAEGGAMQKGVQCRSGCGADGGAVQKRVHKGVWGRSGCSAEGPCLSLSLRLNASQKGLPRLTPAKLGAPPTFTFQHNTDPRGTPGT